MITKVEKHMRRPSLNWVS